MGASWAAMKGGKDVNWGSMAKLCQDMVTKWGEFVEKYNEITTEGNFAIMKGQLEKMEVIMNDLSSFFRHGNYRGDFKGQTRDSDAPKEGELCGN